MNDVDRAYKAMAAAWDAYFAIDSAERERKHQARERYEVAKRAFEAATRAMRAEQNKR